MSTTARVFQFAKQARDRILGQEKSGGLLGVATPKAAEALPWPLRAVLAAGTLLSLALASGLAISAFGVLFAAAAVIYLLVTEVLGISLELDPRSLQEMLARVQAAAQRQRA